MISRNLFAPLSAALSGLSLMHCLATRQVEYIQRNYADPVNELKRNAHAISMASTKAGEEEHAGVRYYFKGLLRSGGTLAVFERRQYLKLEERRIEQGDGTTQAVLLLDEPTAIPAFRTLRELRFTRDYVELYCKKGVDEGCRRYRSKLAEMIAIQGDEARVIENLLKELRIVLPDGATMVIFWSRAPLTTTQTARMEMRGGVPRQVTVQDATLYAWEADLEWRVRQEPVYVAMYLLYPLAFLVDLVWTPLLIVELAGSKCLK